MAETNTHVDSLRWFLTGAASDGGAQTDPDACVGNYRSSTRVGSLGFRVGLPAPRNVRIDYIEGASGEGSATVRATATGSLAFTPPGGTEGAAVAIANGEMKLLEAGDAEPSKAATVTRMSADDLVEALSLRVVDNFNLLWDNVAPAEQVAGDVEHRCVCLKNGNNVAVSRVRLFLGLDGTAAAVDAGGYAAAGAVTVTAKVAGGFADWPAAYGCFNKTTGEVLYYTSRTDDALTVLASGRDVWTDVAGGAAGTLDDVLQPVPLVAIGAVAPASQPAGSMATLADEADSTNQLAGVTFYHPTAVDDADVVEIGKLEAGYIYFVVLKRAVIAEATPTAETLVTIVLNFEADM